MEITFVRTDGAPDRVYVRRGDGSEVSWSFPSYGEGLPHDLVHLVVESVFGLRRGFWGRVADGVDPARVNALANRRGGAGKYAAFGDDLGELLLAEALAGAAWRVEGVDREAAIADACARIGIDAPTPDPARLARADAELDAMHARWRALGPRGSLRLRWDPALGLVLR